MGPVRISARANSVAKPSDSPYYIGLEKASEDPYDRLNNPDGIIQLGLSENRVSFKIFLLILIFVVLLIGLEWFQLSLDLIEKWMSENLERSIIGGANGDLNISGIATYQPLDGMTEMKMVI